MTDAEVIIENLRGKGYEVRKAGYYRWVVSRDGVSVFCLSVKDLARVHTEGLGNQQEGKQ